MTGTSGGTTPHYLLGHTDHELRRLDLQGEIYGPVTRRAFDTAEIGPGSRVLDIGCGSGDVSLAVAALVGPTGSVLGIDRGAAAIEAARLKADRLGVGNALFEQHELDAYRADQRFDTVVGRFILMHQPDPARTLHALTRSLRPGGRVVMIESWMTALRGPGHSHPHSVLYDEIVEWKSRVVGGAGADLDAGGRLRSVMTEAGVSDVETWMEALVAGGADSPYYAYIEQSVRSMLPEAGRQGIGGFAEADCDGLADRLRRDVVSSGGSLVAWPVVVAVGSVPA